MAATRQKIEETGAERGWKFHQSDKWEGWEPVEVTPDEDRDEATCCG